MIDQPKEIRKDEQLNEAKLRTYLRGVFLGLQGL